MSSNERVAVGNNRPPVTEPPGPERTKIQIAVDVGSSAAMGTLAGLLAEFQGDRMVMGRVLVEMVDKYLLTVAEDLGAEDAHFHAVRLAGAARRHMIDKR